MTVVSNSQNVENFGGEEALSGDLQSLDEDKDRLLRPSALPFPPHGSVPDSKTWFSNGIVEVEVLSKFIYLSEKPCGIDRFSRFYFSTSEGVEFVILCFIEKNLRDYFLNCL